MRVVVQRVRQARVKVEGVIVGQIEFGLLVYAGMGQDDSTEDVQYMAKKVVGLRIFEDENGHMNKSVGDVGGAILVVSQFTLYGDCRRGRRPSFNQSMAPKEAEALINKFINAINVLGVRTAEGRFGAFMDIESTNWGPVTIMIDSKKSF